MILGLDHLQISIPAGKLDEALSFYIDLLGFARIPKPASLDPRGAWLVQGGVHVHLGEEAPFATDGCAHPAFRVADLDAILKPLIGRGLRHRDEVGPEGCRRVSVFDPFGNRIELMQEIV
ncbi:MAG: VOC family protein [Nevskia sp.]